MYICMSLFQSWLMHHSITYLTKSQNIFKMAEKMAVKVSKPAILKKENVVFKNVCFSMFYQPKSNRWPLWSQSNTAFLNRLNLKENISEKRP